MKAGPVAMMELDPATLVAGQILPADVASAASAGVTMIVNNRPDGEEHGQPTSADIERAARAAGLSYRHIPVAGGIGEGQVAAMAEAIDSASGKVLAFCRSGTRSTFLWAFARAAAGEDGDSIVARAAAAGFDLSAVRPSLG